MVESKFKFQATTTDCTTTLSKEFKLTTESSVIVPDPDLEIRDGGGGGVIQTLR